MNGNSSGRNRAQGWKHAKKTGHSNEISFGRSLVASPSEALRILRLKFGSLEIDPKLLDVSVDGAKKVASVIQDGQLTTSKVDLVLMHGTQSVAVSLKKSDSGQAWLIQVDRFCEVMNRNRRPVPKDALKALRLFIGGHNLKGLELDFLKALASSERLTPELAAREKKQQRLVAATLSREFNKEWRDLLDYFDKNVSLISDLMFARGCAKNREDFAEVLVYNKAQPTSRVFLLKELIVFIDRRKKLFPVVPGTKNGGSAIVFPAGNLQMHKPRGNHQMQFRHDLARISSISNSGKEVGSH